MSNTKNMFEIARMTVVYDQTQDRMALDAADSEERVRRLWFTRRLLDRLVNALVHQLAASPNEPGPTTAPSPERQAAQIYAQLQARVAKKPEEPVRPVDGMSISLVSEVDLGTLPNRNLVLTFKSADDPVRLAIPGGLLRQWLESLYRNYRKAAWPTGAFPAWVGGNTAPANP